MLKNFLFYIYHHYMNPVEKSGVVRSWHPEKRTVVPGTIALAALSVMTRLNMLKAGQKKGCLG